MAFGASQRLAMWARSANPSTTPRNTPMLSGILDFCPRTAITYSATISSEPKTSNPNSVRRLGLGPKT